MAKSKNVATENCGEHAPAGLANYTSSEVAHTSASFCLFITGLFIVHVGLLVAEGSLAFFLFQIKWYHLIFPVLLILCHVRLFYITCVVSRQHNRHRPSCWCVLNWQAFGSFTCTLAASLLWLFCQRQLEKKLDYAHMLPDATYLGVKFENLGTIRGAVWNAWTCMVVAAIALLLIGILSVSAQYSAIGEKIDPLPLYKGDDDWSSGKGGE